MGLKFKEMVQPGLFIISREMFFLCFPLRVICRNVVQVSRLSHYVGMRELINL